MTRGAGLAARADGDAIAVIGLGCVLPDAFSPAAFWENVLAGRSALRPLEGGGWDWRRYVGDDGDDVSHCGIGARVEGYDFDWRRFRMPPLEAERVNPMQLMVLDAGAQALGEVAVVPRETTGVFLGATGLGWQPDNTLRIRAGELLEAVEAGETFASLPAETRRAVLERTRAGLDGRLRPVTEDDVVNTSASVAAGRIAMHFDLFGPHFSVDAGFASALAALDVGVRSLADGTVDLALVGGASELLTPLELVAFSRLGGLARDEVRPFDERADGTLLGEGVAIFALKRLEDALRDGETVLAVVRGVAGASDGRGRSLLAPSSEGQALAMRRAWEAAGADPATVAFVECHATGTPVGDESELHALAEVFPSGPPGTVPLGSAKPFVGHLRAAAGAAGLLRAVLALRHRLYPAQIGFASPSPRLRLDETPFYVPGEHVSLSGRGGGPLRAAVSAFGFGGVDYHAVLEAAPAAVPEVVRRPRPRPEPAAVVGMGGVFPTGRGVRPLWDALLDGVDCTATVPAERWDPARFHDPDPERLDRTQTALGCFLPELPDPGGRDGIPPSAHATVDPAQLLLLDAAEEALADAGLPEGPADRYRTAVVLAFLPYQGKRFAAHARICFGEYAAELERALAETGVDGARREAVLRETEAIYKRDLPRITEDTLTGYLGSVNAARIARRYDLRGPHFVVDSACASSHAAFAAAVQLLRSGVCDTVLTGGSWCDIAPEFFVAACRFNALSATAISPFDAAADGFVPGEGGGVLVLRRLADAEAAGQRVHALVRAVAGSSDGGGRSVLAPTVEGEALALRRALEQAGVDPASVDYVECHGTGTALGDVVELEALIEAYGGGRRRPLLVGSVKSNLGHLNAAAGVPALIKTVLAVREGVIPPSLKVAEPNPQVDFARGPLEVVTATRRWETPDGAPRRAGVSGFGVGGSNMHLLVEEHRPAAVAAPPTRALPEPHRLPIAVAAGETLAACVGEMRRLVADARGLGGREFLDLLEASQRPEGGPFRLAVVAPSPETLSERFAALERAAARGLPLDPLRRSGVFSGRADRPLRAAAMFPGQGPHYGNMLAAALPAFPVLRETLDAADGAYRRICGRPLTPAFLVGDRAFEQDDADIHCAVLAVNCALFRLLEHYGFDPEAVLGQSAGELSALVAAGVLSLEDALRAVHERTASVLALDVADPGAMLALACGAERARELIDGLPGFAVVAADNSPASCIVSADREALEALVRRCAEAEIHAERLAVSHGYHSELIGDARPRYLETLRTLAFRAPTREVVSTITGASAGSWPAGAYPERLASQLVEPVRLRAAVEELHGAGVRLFVECGPKWPLSTFVDDILGDRPHVAQPTLHPKVGELEQIHRALACLFVHGACTLTPGGRVERAADRPAPRHDSVGDVRELLRRVRDLIDDFLADAPAAEAGTAVAEPTPPERPEPTVEPVPAADAVPSADPAPAPAAFERAARLLVEGLVRRTGYPEEMLELDLDLEADLGIDTVKQVAVVAEIREALGLDVDPAFRLRDHNTIRKLAEHLASRLDGATREAPPARPLEPALAAALAEAGELLRRGEAVEATDLRLDGDGGAACARIRRLDGPAPAPAGAAEPNGAPPHPGVDALLARLGQGEPGRATPRNVRVTRFDRVTGELELSAGGSEAEAAAALVAGAFLHALAGWYALTGAHLALAGADAIRIHRLPRPGERLRVEARLVAPSAAHVELLAGRELVARVEGLRAARLPGAAADDGNGDGGWGADARALLGR